MRLRLVSVHGQRRARVIVAGRILHRNRRRLVRWRYGRLIVSIVYLPIRRLARVLAGCFAGIIDFHARTAMHGLHGILGRRRIRLSVA
jgi:hypothetical protein